MLEHEKINVFNYIKTGETGNKKPIELLIKGLLPKMIHLLSLKVHVILQNYVQLL